MKSYHILLACLSLCISVSCGGSSPGTTGGAGGTGGSAATCFPGESRPCSCSNGSATGIQFCATDQSEWSQCDDSLACRSGPSSTASSSSSGGSCVPLTKAVACGESECGIRYDMCGGAYACGVQPWPLCADDKVCIFTAETDGACTTKAECVQVSEYDSKCAPGQQMVACNQAVGYAPGHCQIGTGVCVEHTEDSFSFVPAIRLSCCTPCAPN